MDDDHIAFSSAGDTDVPGNYLRLAKADAEGYEILPVLQDRHTARPYPISGFERRSVVFHQADTNEQVVRIMGLSGFPNAETLNLTMSYVDVSLIGHRVQTRKGPV